MLASSLSEIVTGTPCSEAFRGSLRKWRSAASLDSEWPWSCLRPRLVSEKVATPAHVSREPGEEAQAMSAGQRGGQGYGESRRHSNSKNPSFLKSEVFNTSPGFKKYYYSGLTQRN